LKSSPSDSALNVAVGVFYFEFDEFVVLKDISQLMISPQIATKPSLTIEGKRVKMSIEVKELLPHTTYQVDLSHCIADLHEGNVLDKLVYLFSTGPQLDTLSLQGVVKDAVTNAPEPGACVVLNEVNQDSSIYKQPLYLVKADKNGQFNFSALPRRNFELFAFTDNNRNGLYDGESEKVAFYSKPVMPGIDTGASLHLFREKPTRVFVKKIVQPNFGAIQFVLNSEDRITLTPLGATERGMIYHENKKDDTLTFFYHGLEDTLKATIQLASNSQVDTLSIALPVKRKTATLKNIQVKLSAYQNKSSQYLTLNFPVWMDSSSLDRKKLKLISLTDSQAVVTQPSWSTVNVLRLNFNVREGVKYLLTMDTAGVFSKEGVKSDFVSFPFQTQRADDFGKLTMQVLFQQKGNYLVQLLTETESVIHEKKVELALSSSGKQTFVFDALRPGNYKLRIIKDSNENGIWDTGNVIKRQQPEEIFTVGKIFIVQSDWEAEEEIKSPF